MEHRGPLRPLRKTGSTSTLHPPQHKPRFVVICPTQGQDPPPRPAVDCRLGDGSQETSFLGISRKGTCPTGRELALSDKGGRVVTTRLRHGQSSTVYSVLVDEVTQPLQMGDLCLTGSGTVVGSGSLLGGVDGPWTVKNYVTESVTA